MSLLNGFIPTVTDSEGRGIPGKLYSYDTGTYTPKDTYSDAALTIPNANPLDSDGAGRFFDVYLGAGGYRLELRDDNDVVLWTQDDYYQALDGSDLANIDADIATTQQMISKTFYVGVDSGVADAYVLSAYGVQVEPNAYANGMVIGFLPLNTNTGASTVNINSLGLRNLVDALGNPLTAGFLSPLYVYQFVYVSGQFVFFFKSGLVTTDFIDNLAVTTAKIAANAVTTAKIADDNVTVDKLADGTAYKLLGYASNGAPTEWSNFGRLLASGSLTATASLSFILSTLDTAQSVDNCYLIRLIGIQPASDDQELWATLSSDAGSTYAATVYESNMYGSYSNGLAAAGGYTAGTQILAAGSSSGTLSFSNAANETGYVEILLANCNTGTSIYPHITTRATYVNAAGNLTQLSGGATRLSAADYDAIKFTWEGGGNFAAVGKYYIFKLPNIT